MKTRKRNEGFTLVEILIVVVILGILAAIVIPQFTQASTEAKNSSLASNLQSIRSQIELYKIQHNDAIPSAGSATFEQCMLGKTDQYGAVGTDFGPYLQKLPLNPFATGSTATITVAAGAGTTGVANHWHYDTSATGDSFHANDSDPHYLE